MANYRIVLDVPDDFDPTAMDIELSYPDDSVTILSESFEDNTDTIEKLHISEHDINKNSVVLIKVPPEFSNNFEDIRTIQELLEAKYGCITLSMLDDIDFMVQNSAEAIDMLKKMIDKINLRSSIKIA